MARTAAIGLHQVAQHRFGLRLEKGSYDPNQEPSVIKFDEEATKEWLANGAQPTDRVAKLLKTAGIQ